MHKQEDNTMLRLRRDIPLFPEGRRKALTLSYDDGVTQDERLIDLMRGYGIKGTFNISAGLAGDNDWLEQPGIQVEHHKFPKERIAEVYAGQEIAVHTMTHPDLTKVPEGMAAYEIAACRRELEELVKAPVTGMAYPMGTWNDRVKRTAASCGITYARTTKPTFDFALPEDFLEWHPTCHHTEPGMMELLEKFLKPIDPERFLSPWLYFLWGHAYEFDGFGQWEEIEEFLKKASGHEEIWYASNGEICEYLKAVRNLVYSATGDYIYNPSCIDVWMLIDGKKYRIRSGETIVVPYVHH